MRAVIEQGPLPEGIPSEAPEPAGDNVERGLSADPHFLDHRVVEVTHEVLPRARLGLEDLLLEVLFELPKGILDLRGGATLLIDLVDPLFESNPGWINSAEHLVTGAENRAEKGELGLKQLVNPTIRGICRVDEINHHHIALLAVTVTAADALLDSLGVPRQVVIDHQIAKLQIDTLRGGLGRQHDLRAVPEMLHQGCAQVRGLGAGNSIRAIVPAEPILVDRLRSRVGIRAVEKDHLATESPFLPLQNLQQVLLRPPRLGEDDSLLAEDFLVLVCLRLLRLAESVLQRLQECCALGVLPNGAGKRQETL